MNGEVLVVPACEGLREVQRRDRNWWVVPKLKVFLVYVYEYRDGDVAAAHGGSL